MGSPLELASDIMAAATALGGLILVYLGGVVSSYASYERAAQAAVLSKHQFRAWFAVVALSVALLSATLALISKWMAVECVALAAIIFLLLALFLAVVSAILVAKDIK